MSNVLRLALVDPDDVSRDTLKSMLLGLDMVWLEAECSRYEFFADVVAQTSPDVGVVALDNNNPDKAISLIDTLSDASPECCVLAVSSSTDGALILKAMRAGVREFLTKPVQVEDLLAALERLAEQRFGRGSAKSRSSNIVAICGATGGVGTTSLAVNVACSMAARDSASTTALVDLDLSLGDADVFLDTIPDYTLLDVAQNINRLDFALLKRSLTRHASGVYLLPRPVHMQDAGLITPDDLQRVIGLLKATFNQLVLDLSKAYTPLDLVALKAADHVLVVIQLDLPCLRNVVRLLMSFGEIEGLLDKVKIVVNRVGLDSGQISLKKAQETIGREISYLVPNDYRTMVEVRNNGVPLVEQAPRAKITQSIMGIAESLMGASGEKTDAPAQQPAGQAAGKSSWLSSIFAKGPRSEGS